MNKFDQLFFSRYVDDADSIEHVFHRHIFIVLEDIILWIFFGLVIPGFLYSQNAFGIRESLEFWQVIGWMMIIYCIVIYKLCDWYYDVWIATDKSMIDVRWKWFTSNLLYIPYEKIEGVEVRTRSVFHSMIGMSDVIIKLAGDDTFALTSAAQSGTIISYVQSVGKHGKHKGDNREPFEILVDTLSDVVKGQIASSGKSYLTREYVEKLDETLAEDDAIDLRRTDDKIEIENWKKEHIKTTESGEDDEHHKH